MNNLDNVLNSLQDQSRSEYTAKRTGLQYRQNEYDKASSESSQRTSRWLNGILSAVQLAAQILPFFLCKEGTPWEPLRD